MSSSPDDLSRSAPFLLLLLSLTLLAWTASACQMTNFNGTATTTGAQANLDEDLGVPASCPLPRAAAGMCETAPTWARHPEGGPCCRFGSRCEVPTGWQTYAGNDCGRKARIHRDDDLSTSADPAAEDDAETP